MCFCRAQWVLKTSTGGLSLTYSFTVFRTFSPSKPAKSLHTQKNRQFFNEPEENFWMVMVFTYIVYFSEFVLYSYGWSLPLGIQGSPLVIASEERCSTAAAAKSLQLCPTLCDPIDGSPPGSLVPGILQARTLEWVSYSTVSSNLKIKVLFGVFVFGGSFKKFWCWDVFKFI